MALFANSGKSREQQRDTVRPLKYYAFLSYSHADAALADWLHDSLERFRTPSSLAGRLTANGVMPRRLTPIFRDRHELPASDNLAGGIRDSWVSGDAGIDVGGRKNEALVEARAGHGGTARYRPGALDQPG